MQKLFSKEKILIRKLKYIFNILWLGIMSEIIIGI